MAVGTGVAGGAVMLVGIVAAARGWQTDGVTPFLVVGAFLIALAVLQGRINRIDFEAGGAKLGMLLGQIASDTSKEVVEELQRLGVADLAAAYEFVNRELRDETAIRIRLQDELVRLAGQRALERPPDEELLNAAMEGRSPAGRAIAVGFAMSHPGLVALDSLTETIMHPRSGTEQYHALLLAEKVASHLGAADRSALKEAIEEAPFITEDAERGQVAQRVLARL